MHVQVRGWGKSRQGRRTRGQEDQVDTRGTGRRVGGEGEASGE